MKVFQKVYSLQTIITRPGTERVQSLADILRSALCCHSNETPTPIANPSNSAQLEGTPYHSPTYIRVRAVVWECGEGHTDRHTDKHTDTQTAVINIHFASTMPHAKCNNVPACKPATNICNTLAVLRSHIL